LVIIIIVEYAVLVANGSDLCFITTLNNCNFYLTNNPNELQLCPPPLHQQLQQTKYSQKQRIKEAIRHIDKLQKQDHDPLLSKNIHHESQSPPIGIQNT